MLDELQCMLHKCNTTSTQAHSYHSYTCTGQNVAESADDIVCMEDLLPNAEHRTPPNKSLSPEAFCRCSAIIGINLALIPVSSLVSANDVVSMEESLPEAEHRSPQG